MLLINYTTGEQIRKPHQITVKLNGIAKSKSPTSKWCLKCLKACLRNHFFASSLTLLLFKWIYLNTSRNYSETITQCVCRNEFSLALEGLLIGFWATSHKTSIHLIMLSLYMNTEKCVSWPNIEYKAGKKSIVLFQRHLGALTLVCLICHSGGRSRTNPQNVTTK